MMRNGMQLTFHHMGIPTEIPQPGERYSPVFDMFTADSDCQFARIQYHRFGKNSSLHPLIRTYPHLAFKVADLDRAIVGAKILLGPYEPIPGYRVAIIEDAGFPIELVQTLLNDKELWSRAETSSILYTEPESTFSE